MLPDVPGPDLPDVGGEDAEDLLPVQLLVEEVCPLDELNQPLPRDRLLPLLHNRHLSQIHILCYIFELRCGAWMSHKAE